MKELKAKKYNFHYDYEDDAKAIIKVYADRGYKITFDDAVFAWEQYSGSYCAGWLILGDMTDEDIFKETFEYFEEA